MVCAELEQCESRGGRPGLPVPNSPYGLCGRKAPPDSGAKYGYDTVLIDNKLTRQHQHTPPSLLHWLLPCLMSGRSVTVRHAQRLQT